MSNTKSAGSLDWISEELRNLKSKNLHRELSIRESPHVGGMVQIEGRQLIDFGSNDYLALSADVRLVDAVKSNSGYVGWGSGASPLVHGRGTLHARLESELARFEEKEAALTFSSGFTANLGVISALVSKPDAIFSDEKNHASIIDGCRLSGAKIFVYRHNDIEHLQQLLTEYGSKFRRSLIATDGLFSMDGDLARLPELLELSRQFQAMLLVDEAHATGVFGEKGMGVSEHFGIHDQIDIIVGTLSKSVGCHGGFVAGSNSLVNWITNHARSYIFSTAVPDATSMAAVAALGLIGEMKNERQNLLANADLLRNRLVDMGWNTGNSESQIVPIILGQPEQAIKARDQLMESGMFVPAIRPPAVPANESLLRISLNAHHSVEMIDQLVKAIENLKI